MNATDIRDLSVEEIQDKMTEAREELFRLRFRSATQQLENPSLLRKLRRDVARLKTIQHQRTLTGSGR